MADGIKAWSGDSMIGATKSPDGPRTLSRAKIMAAALIVTAGVVVSACGGGGALSAGAVPQAVASQDQGKLVENSDMVVNKGANVVEVKSVAETTNTPISPKPVETVRVSPTARRTTTAPTTRSTETKPISSRTPTRATTTVPTSTASPLATATPTVVDTVTSEPTETLSFLDAVEANKNLPTKVVIRSNEDIKWSEEAPAIWSEFFKREMLKVDPSLIIPGSILDTMRRHGLGVNTKVDLFFSSGKTPIVKSEVRQGDTLHLHDGGSSQSTKLVYDSKTDTLYFEVVGDSESGQPIKKGLPYQVTLGVAASWVLKTGTYLPYSADWETSTCIYFDETNSNAKTDFGMVLYPMNGRYTLDNNIWSLFGGKLEQEE